MIVPILIALLFGFVGGWIVRVIVVTTNNQGLLDDNERLRTENIRLRTENNSLIINK